MILDKQQLRQNIREKRRALSEAEQEQAANRALTQLKTHPLFTNAKRIALYLPFDGELDAIPLLEYAIAVQKQCYLPILHPTMDNYLLFAPYQCADHLEPNRYGIMEPIYNEQTAIEAEQLDLILLPLVAFDEQGNRIGLGKGYYDRSLAMSKIQHSSGPRLIGLAHEFQCIPTFEAQEWDVPLDGVLTDENFYIFEHGGIPCDFG